MFQRAMLLAVVFVLSVSDSSNEMASLLRATAYMKGNHKSITSDLEKREENWSPCFCNI